MLKKVLRKILNIINLTFIFFIERDNRFAVCLVSLVLAIFPRKLNGIRQRLFKNYISKSEFEKAAALIQIKSTGINSKNLAIVLEAIRLGIYPVSEIFDQVNFKSPQEACELFVLLMEADQIDHAFKLLNIYLSRINAIGNE